MDRTEHVHIISAGEKIHIAYPAMFRELPAISRTMVFTDSIVHEGSPDPVTEKHRFAVRNAVSAVQEISASLSIPFTRVMIYPPAYTSVQSALAKIRRVPLPDRTISSLLANPNHQKILAILLNRKKMKKDAAKGTVPAVPALWVPRQYLYQQARFVLCPVPGKENKTRRFPQSRLYTPRRAGSQPQNCPMPHSPGLWAPSAMPGSLRRNTFRTAGKRRPTGLLMPGRPPSGFFPIRNELAGQEHAGEFLRQDPGSLFVHFLMHIFLA